MVSNRFLNQIYRELMILASAESHYPYVYKMAPSTGEPGVERKHRQIRHLRLIESGYVENEFEVKVIRVAGKKWLAA
jgi:hypothetical protein